MRTPSRIRIILLLWIVQAVLPSFAGLHAEPPGEGGRVVHVGPEYNLEELFLHDDGIVDRSQGLALTPATVRKHPGNPILVKDRPWEVGLLNYTCVLQDREEGLFKMWYQIIRPKAGGGGNESWCLYATSPDGLVWEKPELGIVEHDGSTRNNILFYEYEGIRGTPSYWVEKDYAASDPSRRYKMMLQRWDFRGRGAAMAHSPDGIHWTIPEFGNRLGPFDTRNIFFWDDIVGAYVGYFRSHVGSRRSISRATSPDGYHWSRPVTIHTPDERDPPTWHLYTPGIFKYAGARNAYFMLTAGFDEVTHAMYGELGTSRDGIEWHRFRQPFLGTSGEGEWDGGHVMPIPADASMGGETALFYQGSTTPAHDSTGKRGIGVAFLGRGAFVGRKAATRGSLLTHPLRIRDSRSRFYLNADAGEGSIRAELLDGSGQVLEGFARDDCRPIRGRGSRLPVHWTGQDDLKQHLRNGTVRLKLYLDQATVYGFYCRRPPRR